MSEQVEEDYKEQNEYYCAIRYLVRMKEWFIHENLVKFFPWLVMPEGRGH